MAKKFNFQKATSTAKSVYNKSHAGFKKANTVAKKIVKGAAFLNKQANVVNSIAATHKGRRVRKANTYIKPCSKE